uniref:hypothetical protein n=1 Tax=Mycolicibacterium fortuitum TaxID=1766 RepID=UPI002626C25A
MQQFNNRLSILARTNSDTQLCAFYVIQDNASLIKEPPHKRIFLGSIHSYTSVATIEIVEVSSST